MAMSFASTAFGIAVPSIVKLLKYELLLNKTVKDGLASLQAELKAMHAFLGAVSSLAPNLQLDPQVKLQANEVSYLSHAIEKKLHSFVVLIESTKDDHNALLAETKRIIINHEIDMYINDTQKKVEKMRQRHGSYPSLSSLKSKCKEKLDPYILAKYKGESEPVGIDGAIADLTNMLSEGNHAMISIVGMGGMGKTTLAQAVFNKMKSGVDCEAFVVIGHSAGPEKVLKAIFDGLKIEMGKELDQRQLAHKLRNFLLDKRCFVVIDDIWDRETWKLVTYVFEDSAGSKIITTTRNHKVAKEVGAVYEIKLLSTDDSRKLLRTKSKVQSHDTEFDILSDKILRKCGGVPMASTLIGSFLAKKQRSEWNREYDSFGLDGHEDSPFEVITKVMRYSYIDLPYNIQNCFLYLNLFPKDHWIEKNMLIWMWVADGLVDDGSFETGETYFNELIGRCMIQWAVSPRDVGQGGCSVHSLMFDLIRDLSSRQEQNFSTVLDMKQESPSQTSRIHRLAIHQKINQNTSLEVEQVRSFFACTCPGSSLPPLSKFAHVRAIDLEACDLSVGDCKLGDLGKLNGLKYVGLVGTPVAKLPVEKGDFKFLQTLDVRATGISELPPFVQELRRLRCLRAGKGTRMMGRVGKLTSLEELGLHSADKSPDFAAELRKLTKLRVLVIHFDEMDESMQKELVESLGYLNKLQVLQIWFDTEGKVRLGGWEDSVPNPELRQLLLYGVILSEQTLWIHHVSEGSAPKLSKLLLQVENLTAQHLEILGQMPSLRSLYLHNEEDKYRLSYTANKNEFQVLEYLNTNIELICGDGGLPMIQELEVGGIRAGRDVGLQGNMPLLKTATYHLDCQSCLPLRVQKAEEKLKQAELAHPNRPKVTIRRWNNVVTEMWQVMELIEGTPLSLVRPPPSQENIFDNPEFVKQMSEDFARAIHHIGLPVGAPPVFTVSDATDATKSPSQEINLGPAALFVNLFNKLLHDEGLSGPRSASSSADADADADANLAESSSAAVSTIKPDGTGSLLSAVLSWLKSPDGAAKMSEVADKHGMDPVACKRIWKKCLLNPELITIMDNLLDEDDVSEYMRLHEQLMEQEILDYFSGHDIDEPSSPPGYAGRGHTDNLLSWLISLYGADRASALVSEGAAKFEMDRAAFKIMLKKYVLNPKLTAAMESAVRNHDRSEFERLMAQVMEPSSRPPPKLDIDDTFHLVRNTPEGAAAITEGAAEFGVEPAAYEKILKKCMRNPKLVAAMHSAVQDDDGSLMEALMEQLLEPETVHYFTEQYMEGPSSTPGYPHDGRADASSSSEPLPESSGQDGEKVSRMLRQVLPTVEQVLSARASSRQPSAAQVDAHNVLNRGEPADASGKLSGLSSDPALATQSDMMDALASSTTNEAQSRQNGENYSTIFNLNERLAIMEKALAANERSGKPSSAQVDAHNMLNRGEPADASGKLSGLSSDPALAAQSDMMDALASSTTSEAQSRQDGENYSTIFNLNERLAIMEKALAANERSGKPSSAQVSHLISH